MMIRLIDMMKVVDSGLKGVLTIVLLIFCAMAGMAEDMDTVRVVKVPYVEIKNKQLVEVIEKEVLPICFPDGENKALYDVYLNLDSEYCSIEIEATAHTPWIDDFRAITMINGYMVYIDRYFDSEMIEKTGYEITVLTDGRCDRRRSDSYFSIDIDLCEEDDGWEVTDINEEKCHEDEESSLIGSRGYCHSRNFFCRSNNSVKAKISKFSPPKQYVDSLLTTHRENLNEIEIILRKEYIESIDNDLVVWGRLDNYGIGKYVVIVCDSTFSSFVFIEENDEWKCLKHDPAFLRSYLEGNEINLKANPPNKIKLPKKIPSYVPGPEMIFDLRDYYFAIKHRNSKDVDFITPSISDFDIIPMELNVYLIHLITFDKKKMQANDV